MIQAENGQNTGEHISTQIPKETFWPSAELYVTLLLTWALGHSSSSSSSTISGLFCRWVSSCSLQLRWQARKTQPGHEVATAAATVHQAHCPWCWTGPRLKTCKGFCLVLPSGLLRECTKQYRHISVAGISRNRQWAEAALSILLYDVRALAENTCKLVLVGKKKCWPGLALVLFFSKQLGINHIPLETLLHSKGWESNRRCPLQAPPCWHGLHCSTLQSTLLAAINNSFTHPLIRLSRCWSIQRQLH